VNLLLHGEYSIEIFGDYCIEIDTGKIHDENVQLSKLIDILNDRFGTDFKPADQLFLDSVVEDAVADENLQQAAHANTIENFKYVFSKELESLFIDRMEQNEDIFNKFMGDPNFNQVIEEYLRKRVYEEIRSRPGDAHNILPFRIVSPKEQDKFKTCVPLVPLKVAAGAFSDPQQVENGDWEWVSIDSRHSLHKGMFVAQVVGKSMEPAITDGSTAFSLHRLKELVEVRLYLSRCAIFQIQKRANAIL